MALADANVIVWVAVRLVFQTELNVATPLAVIAVPTNCALLRLVKTLERFVEKLLLTSIISPDTGFEIAVTVVLVWLAAVVNLEKSVAH